MIICVEPMLIMGTQEIFIDPLDDWTVRSKNGLITCHDEHMVLVTEKGYEILTK
jgi:methionyl aminopeptidase